jgi:hypothetical protein
MILLKVEYEFFDFEEPSSTTHDLYRQIRLQFADSVMLYVSWTWERQNDMDSKPYSITYGTSSYFTDEAATVIDVSDEPLWASHIGRAVEITYSPLSSSETECQVLEIRSSASRTFIYAVGRDRVGISNNSPI